MSDLKNAPNDRKTAFMRPLRWRVWRTRVVLLWERILEVFWPAMTLAGFAAALYILRDFMPFVMPVVGIMLIGVLYFLYRGVMSFRWPRDPEIYHALDKSVQGSPVRALADELALGWENTQSKELWAMHLQRMAQRAKLVDVPDAHVRLAKTDPYGLRLLSIFAVIFAVIFVSGSRGFEKSGQGAGSVAAGPSFEAWAKPPLYTGLPTVYLNDVEQGTPISMTQGSEFLIRAYGDVSISEDLSVIGNTQFPSVEGVLAEAKFIMTKSGTLQLADRNGITLAWDISVLADLPPMIEITGEMSRDLQGAMQLPFRASDDYGVTGGTLDIALDLDNVDRRYGLALPPEEMPNLIGELPLPFNARTDDFEGIIEEDFAKHGWAGLPVIVGLNATDAAGNVGQITPLNTELARKRFFDPLAAALIDVRRQLLWNRQNAERAIYLLRAVTYRPEGVFAEEDAYTMARDAIAKMEASGDANLVNVERDEVTELLWTAAILIEDGDLDDAKEQMRRAQERLKEAMENGATDEEIAELMQALRDATDAYMDELAENSEDPTDQPAGGDGETITQDEIQEMMDEIQRLMEEGRMEEAQELLRQLQELLENMQVVQQSGQGSEGEEGEQSEQDMQEMLEDQQELADETFQELQEQFNQEQQGEGEQQQSQSGQQEGDSGQENDTPEGEQLGQEQGQQGSQQGQQEGGQQGQNQGENGDASNGDQGQQGENGQGQSGAGASDLAGRQKALRQMLNNQRRNLPNDGSQAGREAGEALSDAERQMGDAEESLREGEFGQALNQQSDALESLRRGMRAMNEQQRDAQNGTENAGQQNGPSQGTPNDPLGRATGQDRAGRAFNDDALNKGLDQTGRGKAYENLLDELKGRAQDRTRPEFELEYLERLLDRF